MMESRKRWGECRYYSFDYYLKETFGEKLYKIALDGKMSCPNRDGTLGRRGCIFCSEGGSGDFAIHGKCGESITEQIDRGILEGHKKSSKYIAYLQSYTNTYAPLPVLRSLYTQIIAHPQIAALSIGTRPDCFSPEIYDLLDECQQTVPVWIELGLQTIHEKTANYIRRGYPLSAFEETVKQLQRLHIPIIVHVILGLPGENQKDMLQTIDYLNQIGIQGIKLQLLHILKNTDLATQYQQSISLQQHLFTQTEYVEFVTQCIGSLSPDIVIHRLTGDGPKDLLIAPLWSQNKRQVLNQISHQLKTKDIYQGKFLYKGSISPI